MVILLKSVLYYEFFPVVQQGTLGGFKNLKDGQGNLAIAAGRCAGADAIQEMRTYSP
jgi:hypothetical protein